MRLFGMDKQLNISTYYFKPGFAYGGSCLPKDLKALNALAHDNYIDVPVLNSIKNSNEFQKDIAYNLISSKNKNKIAMPGHQFPVYRTIRSTANIMLKDEIPWMGFAPLVNPVCQQGRLAAAGIAQ